MENALWAVGKAMQDADDILRTSFTSHAMTTVNLAFTLMQLQGGWVDGEGKQRAGQAEILQDARIKYLLAVIGGPESAAKAKSLQVEYDILATKCDGQTGDWQAVIRSANEQVMQDNDAREANISLLDSVFGANKYAENLVKRGMRG